MTIMSKDDHKTLFTLFGEDTDNGLATREFDP